MDERNTQTTNQIKPEDVRLTVDEVEHLVKTTGTGYPSIDKPWLHYYSKRAVEGELPDATLYEYLYRNNRAHMDFTALNYMGRKITYRELFKRIDQAARAFMAQGVQPGDIVPVLTVASVPYVVCYYALNKIGAIPDFINVLSTAKDLVKFFRSDKAKLVVSMDICVGKTLLAAKAIGVERVVAFSLNQDLPVFKKLGFQKKTKDIVDDSYLLDPLVLTWHNFLETGKTIHDTSYKKDPTTPALLAHTGGTTGFPKSVLLSDHALNAVSFQYHRIFEEYHRKNGVFLNLVVPFVVYGSLINTHMPLTMGCQLVLIPQFDAQDWPEYINKYQPNFISAIPNYLSPMLRNPRMRNVNMSCINVIAVGGDACSNALEVDMNKFLKSHGSSARLAKGYGMTELSSTGCTCFDGVNSLGSVGVPLPKNNLLIYDNEHDQECKYNEIGEICFQGPGLMNGYMDNEQEMKTVIRKHPDGSVWVHTGDLGYMNRRSLLHIVGRIKRVVLTQYKGVAYRVYPNVVEDILMEHPDVLSACVVGMSDDSRGRTKAFIALKDHASVNEREMEKELRDFCEKEMAEYMVPYIYEFRGSLPLTPAGKVDYKLLEMQNTGTHVSAL